MNLTVCWKWTKWGERATFFDHRLCFFEREFLLERKEDQFDEMLTVRFTLVIGLCKIILQGTWSGTMINWYTVRTVCWTYIQGSWLVQINNYWAYRSGLRNQISITSLGTSRLWPGLGKNSLNGKIGPTLSCVVNRGLETDDQGFGTQMAKQIRYMLWDILCNQSDFL